MTKKNTILNKIRLKNDVKNNVNMVGRQNTVTFLTKLKSTIFRYANEKSKTSFTRHKSYFFKMEDISMCIRQYNCAWGAQVDKSFYNWEENKYFYWHKLINSYKKYTKIYIGGSSPRQLLPKWKRFKSFNGFSDQKTNLNYKFKYHFKIISNNYVVKINKKPNILRSQSFPALRTCFNLTYKILINKTASYPNSLVTNLLFMLITTPIKNKDYWESFTSNFFTFMNIWPLHQWISSLVTLVLLYIWAGHIYNRKLLASGGWISTKTRIYMILIDLGLNLAIGMYYMNFRETLFGQFMMHCPIAISPFIFLCEFIIVDWYYKKYTLPEENKAKERTLALSKEKENNLEKDINSTGPLNLSTDKSSTLESDVKKESVSPLSKKNYNPDPLMEVRFSISLQRSLRKKFQAAVWQWSRWGRILPEPKGKERQTLKNEIDFRQDVETKKLTKNSTSNHQNSAKEDKKR